MKKKFLKALCLVGVLAFAMPVVTHFENVGYAKESITLEDKNKEIFLSVENGNLEKVKELIENGADVNAIDHIGRTPLHYVNDVLIAKLLIEHGADINAYDHDIIPMTPLHYADTKIAKLLIENGADVNAIDSGLTPLHWAGCEKAKLLIENGANVNAIDGYGNTPLYWADAETAKLLIENGADVNATNYVGHTALHYIDSVEKAKVLIENGADVNAKDCVFTPLEYVCAAGKLEIAKLLIENGADISVTSSFFGGTLLEVAHKNGHQDIVNLLLEVH